jgi:hypothetical protein
VLRLDAVQRRSNTVSEHTLCIFPGLICRLSGGGVNEAKSNTLLTLCLGRLPDGKGVSEAYVFKLY